MLPDFSGKTTFGSQWLFDTACSIPLQRLEWPELNALGLEVLLRRDDTISPVWSGNKPYKLFFNLKKAISNGHTGVLSFGGAWSNHLYALAAFGAEAGLPTVGVVRGHPGQHSTAMLRDVQAWGMRLCYLGRSDYAQKNITALPEDIRDSIERGQLYLLPEGGDNLEGVYGCQFLGQAISRQMGQAPYTLCSATATGTTLAGLVSGSPQQCNNLAISVLKGQDRITPKVEQYLADPAISQWLPQIGCENRSGFLVNFDHHLGGYGKTSDELMVFIREFDAQHKVKLDPVYTGKLLFAVQNLAREGYWPAGSTLVVLHSGGQQGRRGFGLSA